MKPSHTPGPWKLFQHASGGHIMMQRQTRQHLMRIQECDGMGDQGAPNLKLVETGPELLAALKVMLLQHPYKDGDGSHRFQACEIAKEAIAKATGESSCES